MSLCKRVSQIRHFTPEEFNKYFQQITSEFYSGKDHFDIYIRIDSLLEIYESVQETFSDFSN